MSLSVNVRSRVRRCEPVWQYEEPWYKPSRNLFDNHYLTKRSRNVDFVSTVKEPRVLLAVIIFRHGENLIPQKV